MRRAVALIAAATTFLAVLLTAAPASATIELVHCTGESRTTYEPGLTNTPADVYQSGDESALCIALLEILTFDAHYEGSINASCNGLAIRNGSGTEIFEWSTGETSVWAWSFVSAASIDGTYSAIAEGPITSGKYAGTMVRQASTLPNLQELLAACNSPSGLTSAEGSLTWTFTSV